MASVRETIIDITDPELRGLLRQFDSPVKAAPWTIGRGDSGPRRFRFVEPISSNRRQFKDADTTGYTIEVAVGGLDAAPTSGTFTVTHDGNASGSIAYNTSGANLQTAINAISSIITAGGVTVTKYGSNSYEIRFLSNGAQADLVTAGTNLLEPETGIYLTTMQPGTGSTPTVQWLRLLQSAIAYQNTFDDYTTGAATVEVLQNGSATQKEIVRISLDQPPYDGSMIVTTGVAEKYSITVTQNNDADALDNLGFIIFDLNGSVGVYFDGTPDASITACDRTINVNTLSTSDTKATVATKLATAIAADSEFTATANGNAVKVTLEDAGDVDDPVDVDSTFTFDVTTQGESVASSVPIDASARDFAAAMNNAVKVTKSGDYQWDLMFRDYGNQPAITVDVAALFPSGYECDLNFITRQCFRLFATSEEASITQFLEVSLKPPGKGPFTVLHIPITVVRDIISTEQEASATLPSYPTTGDLTAGLALKVDLVGDEAVSITTDQDVSLLSLTSEFASAPVEPMLLLYSFDAGFDGDYIKCLDSSLATVFRVGKNGVDAPGLIKKAYKASDTARSSTTSPTADPNLVIAVSANEKWAFEAWLPLTSVDAGGWKGGMTFPTSPTSVKWEIEYSDYDLATFTPIAYHAADSTTDTISFTGGADVVVKIRGTLLNGANAGNISVSWAQAVSDSDATTLRSGARLIITKL